MKWIGDPYFQWKRLYWTTYRPPDVTCMLIGLLPILINVSQYELVYGRCVYRNHCTCFRGGTSRVFSTNLLICDILSQKTTIPVFSQAFFEKFRKKIAF